MFLLQKQCVGSNGQRSSLGGVHTLIWSTNSHAVGKTRDKNWRNASKAHKHSVAPKIETFRRKQTPLETSGFLEIRRGASLMFSHEEMHVMLFKVNFSTTSMRSTNTPDQVHSLWEKNVLERSQTGRAQCRNKNHIWLNIQTDLLLKKKRRKKKHTFLFTMAKKIY